MPDTPHEVEAFAIGLENLANWYRKNPDAPLPTDFGDGVGRVVGKVYSINTAQKLANLSRRLGGHRSKDYAGDLVRVTRDFGGGVVLRLIADRDTTCEQVKVGTRTVNREITEVVGTETVTEDVYEWRCTDSILGGDELAVQS